MKRIRSDIDRRADGLPRAPPCRFLFPSDCIGEIFRHMQTASSRSVAFALCGMCMLLCPPSPHSPPPPVSQSDLWLRALQHLGPHGALIRGWVTHGSDAPVITPAPSTLCLQPPWRHLSGHASLYSGAGTVGQPRCVTCLQTVQSGRGDAAGGGSFQPAAHMLASPREAFPNYGKDTHVVEG